MSARMDPRRSCIVTILFMDGNIQADSRCGTSLSDNDANDVVWDRCIVSCVAIVVKHKEAGGKMNSALAIGFTSFECASPIP